MAIPSGCPPREHCANCRRQSPRDGVWQSADGETVCSMDCWDDVSSGDYGPHYDDHLENSGSSGYSYDYD
ncbi:hypothetical protein ACFFR3_45820 [Nonomuraea salmonea]|uniref:Uncharacterized protein n=1 Tax=Nonomuraea salmonea TaxID=46181 RepID=A0ABV5P2Q6_9ACTN